MERVKWIRRPKAHTEKSIGQMPARKALCCAESNFSLEIEFKPSPSNFIKENGKAYHSQEVLNKATEAYTVSINRAVRICQIFVFILQTATNTTH